ncbi:hypothetical protein HDE_04539 [Halotydeus destructor]|nr:hypothetical protein HDE_04539 [Halotydeus destructor]
MSEEPSTSRKLSNVKFTEAKELTASQNLEPTPKGSSHDESRDLSTFPESFVSDSVFVSDDPLDQGSAGDSLPKETTPMTSYTEYRVDLPAETKASRGSKRRARELSRTLPTDTDTLLVYSKGLLLITSIIFVGGTAITLNELFEFFIIDVYDFTHGHGTLITGTVLLLLTLISFFGLYGAFKLDTCILVIFGIVILIIFILHVVMLYLLKNYACVRVPKKCYRNMATPPGLAPIIVAISELAMAMDAFFMTLVVEANLINDRRKLTSRRRHVVPRGFRIVRVVSDDMDDTV